MSTIIELQDTFKTYRIYSKIFTRKNKLYKADSIFFITYHKTINSLKNTFIELKYAIALYNTHLTIVQEISL